MKDLQWCGSSSSGSVTFTITGSTEPTKLTQVTAALSLCVPSTATVNMAGGAGQCDVEVEVREEVREEVRRERVWSGERRHGEKETAEEGIWR